jgi:hypothetical protein
MKVIRTQTNKQTNKTNKQTNKPPKKKKKFELKNSTCRGRIFFKQTSVAECPFSIRDGLDRDSNETEESDPHLRKKLRHTKIQPMQEESFQTNWFQGMTPFSIRDNFDSDLNVTEESEPHSVNHP